MRSRFFLVRSVCGTIAFVYHLNALLARRLYKGIPVTSEFCGYHWRLYQAMLSGEFVKGKR